MHNISRSKGNQTMKLGQVIEYNNINIFFKNHAQNEVGRLVPDLFLFFKNVLYEVKSGGLQLNFDIVRQFSVWHTIKTNRVKLRLLIRRYAQFLLLEKDLRKFHCLIAFTSSDVGQYMHCNSFLPGFDVI